MREEVEKKGPAPKSSLGATGWHFSPILANSACGSRGALMARRELSLVKPGRVPARLSDHMLDSSPVGDYAVGYDAPIVDFQRPWEWAYVRYGVSAGYSRTFNSSTHPGGFTTFAYQFPTQKAAIWAGAAAFKGFICEFGADPMTVREHRGIVAGVPPGQGDALAWWVQGSRLITVDYTMNGERSKDLARALTVLQAAWQVGTDQGSITETDAL
jgi:hypothetical protein